MCDIHSLLVASLAAERRLLVLLVYTYSFARLRRVSPKSITRQTAGRHPSS
jgi:hypothetical protein